MMHIIPQLPHWQPPVPFKQLFTLASAEKRPVSCSWEGRSELLKGPVMKAIGAGTLPCSSGCRRVGSQVAKVEAWGLYDGLAGIRPGGAGKCHTTILIFVIYQPPHPLQTLQSVNLFRFSTLKIFLATPYFRTRIKSWCAAMRIFAATTRVYKQPVIGCSVGLHHKF